VVFSPTALKMRSCWCDRFRMAWRRSSHAGCAALLLLSLFRVRGRGACYGRPNFIFPEPFWSKRKRNKCERMATIAASAGRKIRRLRHAGPQGPVIGKEEIEVGWRLTPHHPHRHHCRRLHHLLDDARGRASMAGRSSGGENAPAHRSGRPRPSEGHAQARREL
jgi:hypothetical protein